MRNHIDIGRWGEDLAICLLSQQGYRLLERNWQATGYREDGLRGEIDAVLLSPEKELVFLEVKTRTSSRSGYPCEAISSAKRQKLRKLAYAWKQAHSDCSYTALRIDLASICGTPGAFSWEHRQAVV